MSAVFSSIVNLRRRALRVFASAPKEESKEEELLDEEIAPAPSPKKGLHPRVIWQPTETLVYGDPLSPNQLNAYCKDFKSRVVEGSMIYNPPLGTVIPAGIQTLTVQFIPLKTWKYLSASGTVDILVKKRPPVVTWHFPFDTVLFGTLLTEEFRQVQCELKNGKFYFSHEESALLEIGTHTLMVEYEPSTEEAQNFARGYCSVKLRVDGAPCPIKWDIPYSQSAHTEVLKVKAPAVAPNIASDEASGDGQQQPQYAGRRGRRGGVSSASSKPSADANNFIDAAKALPDEKRSSAFCEGAPLIYPDPLPSWLCNAVCTDDKITGHFVYDPPARAKLAAGRHTITATFHPDDTRRYRNSSESRVIQILRSPVPLDWAAQIGLTEGDLLDARNLNCTNVLNLPGTYTYIPTFGAALSEGEYTLRVRFEPKDTVNYLPASAEVPFRVRPKKIPQLHYPTPPPIVHPFPLSKLQLNASVRGGGYFRGTWEYTPPFGAVLPAGDHTITARFIPDKPTVREASVTVQLSVEQGMSRLLWNTPSDIYDGQGLYDSELNCSCTNLKGGKFVYTPPKGTVLPIGKHRLRCHYKPSNKNYMDAYQFVKINVIPRPKSKFEVFK